MEWSLDIPVLFLALGFTCWWLGEWISLTPLKAGEFPVPPLTSDKSGSPVLIRHIGFGIFRIRRKVPGRSDHHSDEPDSSRLTRYTLLSVLPLSKNGRNSLCHFYNPLSLCWTVF
ncbi:hypothetical protein PC41400_10330 [Paenibacillus chitinolyticus]|uniref:Uncharacterized protein n=1 Tax=Paenibacillus chitinolyticus TaxID=79263 RepID=A0A410WUL1_9BACL|nr:hypothetical protein PC41400_10330 [Paenibacillus chitinolyticus]